MNTKIKIEKGIPLPVARSRKKSIWPFDEMKIGDSFLMPKKLSRASSNASNHAKKLNKKFACRKVDENNTRVWRTA